MRRTPPKEHLPSEAISDSAFSLNLSTTSKADQPRRMLCQWPITTRIPHLSDFPCLRTRLVAGSLSGRLERLLAACAHRDAASPESDFPFGGSSSPSRAPLLAFPIRLTCTAIPRSFHDVHDIHDSRNPFFAIQYIRPRATRRLHLPIKFSCMDPTCR